MNDRSKSEARGRGAWVPYLGLAALLVLMAAVPQVCEPVIQDDAERRIWIPDELVHPMRVKAAYDGETMYFRFDLPTPEPSYYHDYWVYDGEGRWRREGRSPVGREPNRLYEDRITFFLDDGCVPEFGRWGAFITASGNEMRFFTDAAPSEEVQAHPHLGPRGRTDVRKWLPETRTDPHDWRTIKPEEELQALREAGYFLDLWHWRAHRSNPIGWSDDELVSEFRWGDQGPGPYTTNWDEDAQRPRYMFDPERAGHHAMRWEEVIAQEYGQEEHLRYALILGDEGEDRGDDIRGDGIRGDGIRGNAIPFDPGIDWRPGDVIPRQVLRRPGGSHADIRAMGVYRDGRWLVDVWRALDTGHPLDDKVLQHKGLYQVAFAAHILSTGSRWHYVSFPLTLGLGREADIAARRFEGGEPPWHEIEWLDLTLFYPGQIDWSHLISRAHAGAGDIAEGKPVWVGHDEHTLARYAVQTEFREEIFAQWRQTTGSLLALIALLSVAMLIITPGRRDPSRSGS